MAPAAASNSMGMEEVSVTVVTGPEALRLYRADWDQLAAHALEPNIFYEAAMMLSALQHMPPGIPLVILLLHVALADGGRQLIGFVPLLRARKDHSRGPTILQSFAYPHSYLTTPLLHRDHGEKALGAVFDWLESRGGARLLGFRTVSADGAFGRLLAGVARARHQPFYVEDWHQRAFFSPAETPAHYLTRTISAKKRKEYRRQKKRLSEKGQLELAVVNAPGPELDRWITQFLELEARGWKKDHHAFDLSRAGRTFFTDAMHGLADKGQLRCLSLTLDGVPVAMKCNLLSADGSGAFAYKIAHDEAYHAYSPGVLLELENIADLHATGGGRWMDSCADPDHPMIDHLWDGRRGIAHIVYGRRGLNGRLLLALLRIHHWRDRPRIQGRSPWPS